ncbi:uncharacterized protein LOC121377254 [Gigantopelta aegis]|uniref:uncharacterized protein LOC121377254 n=1 Tax=Gigantopelta aegis TaxID=1735272 RepID=UPI001B888ABF|nr:uncharacterized protein LOC121377254 [Gigantopelta aegis]
MDMTTTLGEIIDVAKMRKLRFYLRTKNTQPNVVNSIENVLELDSTEEMDDGWLPDLSDDLEIENAGIQEKDIFTASDIPTMEHTQHSPRASTPTDGHKTVTWEDSIGEIQFAGWTPPAFRDPIPIAIQVHRGHVFHDLKMWFITATVILPNGDIEQADDNGGVLRDIVCEFWESFYEQCTLGSDIKVPCLRHDFEVQDWEAIAHVFALGWILQRIIPVRLAPSFLKCCLYGLDPHKNNSGIIEEFLGFVPHSERIILQVALSDFDKVDNEELLDVLTNHECKVLVTKDNIFTTMGQIASKELVQEPSFIKDVFFNTLIGYELDIDLCKVLDRLKPTTKRVLSLLDCEDANAPSFCYLKHYIRELKNVSLGAFLRFTTASDLLLSDVNDNYYRLTVRRVDLDGLARRPIAHTCGRVLELPQKYESFPQFRAEFNAILCSNIWVMDIH